MTEDNTKTIQVRISISDADDLEKLVQSKKYMSVSDAVRVAIRNLLAKTEVNRA